MREPGSFGSFSVSLRVLNLFSDYYSSIVKSLSLLKFVHTVYVINATEYDFDVNINMWSEYDNYISFLWFVIKELIVNSSVKLNLS